MYINRNKANSFIEIIVSLTLALIISTLLLSAIFPIVKSFNIINSVHKKEKSLVIFKNLLTSHLYWSKSKEIRIVNAKYNTNFPKFSDIFEKESEKSGNVLLIKFCGFEKENQRFYINYRCFTFFDGEAGTTYCEYADVTTFNGILRPTKIIEGCEGKFYLEGNNLRIVIKDKKSKKGLLYENIFLQE